MIELTDAAKKRVCDLINEETGSQLRVFVKGGGCSGFQYGLAFDQKQDGDEELPMDDFSILVDRFSKPYLDGVRIDFVDALTGAGFKFENPNATGSCGCGHSFSV